MTNIKFAKYKSELLKEQAGLMEAMQTMGTLSDLVPGHWDTYTDKSENKELQPDALADKFEEESTNEGVMDTLEERLKEVTDAIERIEKGIYGKCINCAMQGKDKEIEIEKLDANPTATTCLACSHLT